MNFDEIEEHRDRVAGLEYEEWRAARAEATPDAAGSAGMASCGGGCLSDDAYEPDDPKSEHYYERMVDRWDVYREGK